GPLPFDEVGDSPILFDCGDSPILFDCHRLQGDGPFTYCCRRMRGCRYCGGAKLLKAAPLGAHPAPALPHLELEHTPHVPVERLPVGHQPDTIGAGGLAQCGPTIATKAHFLDTAMPTCSPRSCGASTAGCAAAWPLPLSPRGSSPVPPRSRPRFSGTGRCSGSWRWRSSESSSRCPPGSIGWPLAPCRCFLSRIPL